MPILIRLQFFVYFVFQTLNDSGLMSIVKLYNPEIDKAYQIQIVESKRVYSRSWSKVLHYVLEIDKPISQQRVQTDMSMKLKDKDRHNIKEKFTVSRCQTEFCLHTIEYAYAIVCVFQGFNKEIEEICKVQKAYAIPDQELRESLKKENCDFIVPRYEMFYNK